MPIRLSCVATFALLFIACLLSSLAAAEVKQPSPATASAPAPAAKDLVPLKIETPKISFTIEMRNSKSSHLDPDIGKPRVALMVPRDVTNIAAKKPLESSYPEFAEDELSWVVDGDKADGNGGVVTLPLGPQWIQVDLEKRSEIFAIVVWRGWADASVYHDVIVQVSDDPVFAKDVTTLFNNDDDNSSKLGVGKDYEYVETTDGRLIDAKGIKARYVRCYSSGNERNTSNRIVEVEVHGRPTK